MSYYFGKDATFTPDFFGGTTPEDTLFQTEQIETTSRRPIECERDEHCPEGEKCRAGRCQPELPPPEEMLILICAGETCQERRRSLFNLNDPDVQKRIASCSGKSIGAGCTPFIEPPPPPPPEEVKACFKGTCEMIPRGVASEENIALCANVDLGDPCGKIPPPPPPNPCDDPVYAAAHPDECGVITKVKACVGGKCIEADRNTVTDRQIFMCKELPLGDVCEHESPCTSDKQCTDRLGPGWRCNENGQCVETIPECTNDAQCKEKFGPNYYCDPKSQTCKAGPITDCENDQDCIDKFGEGYWCDNGTCRKGGQPPECNDDVDCINKHGEGWYCDNGTCKKGDVPPEKGCEGGYKNTSGEPCSYNFESKGIGGEQWCCPKEAAEPLGEYTLPANMQELLDALIARGKELLGKEVGFSEAQKTQMLDALPKEAIESLAARRRELLAMRPGYEPEIEAALGSLAASLTGRREELLAKRPGYEPEVEAGLASLLQSLTGRREEIAGIEPGFTPETIAEMIGALPKELYGKLMGRGEELLDMPLGFTPGSIARMFGRDFETIRAGERGTRESLLEMLSTQGKLGTGVVPERMGKLAWGTEQNIADLMRDIYLQNEMQKRADLYGYTGMAGDILGQGMGYADLVGRTYGGIEEKKKRDVLDYTSAILGIAPQETALLTAPSERRKRDVLDYTTAALGIAPTEMAALTAPSERRKGDVLDYTQAAAQIVPQEMAYARQLQDLLTSFKGMEKADILDFSREAQNIFGTGAGSEQLVEMINAARRGEASGALSQLLALLGLLKY